MYKLTLRTSVRLVFYTDLSGWRLLTDQTVLSSTDVTETVSSYLCGLNQSDDLTPP